MLIGGPGANEPDGTVHDALCTPKRIQELATLVDGIGPAIARIVTWPAVGSAPKIMPLVALAREAKLVVHPYTMRRDDLPKHCPTTDALHAALFRDARVDGVFTDFSDVTVSWLKQNAAASSRTP